MAISHINPLIFTQTRTKSTTKNKATKQQREKTVNENKTKGRTYNENNEKEAAYLNQQWPLHERARKKKLCVLLESNNNAFGMILFLIQKCRCSDCELLLFCPLCCNERKRADPHRNLIVVVAAAVATIDDNHGRWAANVCITIKSNKTILTYVDHL